MRFNVFLGAGNIIPHSLHQVKCENKEMFDTFSHVSSELRAISDKLKSPSPQPIIQFMVSRYYFI